MKKIYLILLFTGIGSRCFAQHEPAVFFKGLFDCIKNADSVGFANRFLSGGQFRLLAQAQLKVKIINQDSLDNTADDDTAFRSRLAKAISQRFLKKLDSLHIERASMQYLDYSYQQERDTSVLCTSLKGALYFKSGNNYYQWNIGEAILIKGVWKVIDPGKIDNLKHHEFLTSSPQRITVFNSLKTAIKVKAVVLQPPPPINKQMPPPPPPEPKKKKKAKQK